MRLHSNQPAPIFTQPDIDDRPVSLSDYAGQTTLISFSRFATCPFCNFRMRELLQRYPDYQARGLAVIAFWQSSAAEIRAQVGNERAPFPIIADPARRIYKLYGVEASWQSAVRVFGHPRLLWRAIHADKNPFKHLFVTGQKNLLPADFIIGPGLKISYAYYGRHIGDHIPFDTLEAWLPTAHLAATTHPKHSVPTPVRQGE